MDPRRRLRTHLRLRSILALAAVGLLAGEPVPIVAEDRAQTAVAPAPLEAGLDEIGELVRRTGYAAVRARLEALAAVDGDPRAQLARTLLGLLAHAHDDPAVARRWLAGNPAPPALEDWRLYVLADSAVAGRDVATARAALAELVARHPDSPLRPDALVRLAQITWEAGDSSAALAEISRARAAALPRQPAVELERLAWRIAVEQKDARAMREAARRLLVLDPIEASKMHLVDSVARLGGGSDWRLWLTDAELVERAEALVEAELPAGALTTLSAVSPAARDLAWHLLEARALVDSGRGVDAYRSLEAIAPATPVQRAELDWQKSLAAAAAARSRNLDAPQRETWRRLERERLLSVARSGAEPALERAAIRRLAERYFDEGRHPEAIAALHQLARLEPDDSRLAKPLWEAGWEAYRQGATRQAIDLWRELAALYPRSSWSRSGSYWTARALERSGEAEAAQRQYLAIVSSQVSDFYARQAALRLAGARSTSLSAPAPEAWPEDRALGRVRLLSDLGLDGLARTELELTGQGADPRARAALAGLVLARSGERRSSLRELKRAFPELGTALQGSAPALALDLYYPLDFRTSIERVAALEGLEPSLLFGMVHQESGFDPTARSHAGARGLMQLMPSTGREVARKLGLPFSDSRLTEPDYSLRLGSSYVRRMLALFDGNVELALAAYNGGPGRISRLWRAAGPDPELDRFLEGLALEEPRHYVKRIVVLAESYRSRHPEIG